MNGIERVQSCNVKNLVFKGGSVKGIAYLGCITRLMQLFPTLLPKVERVIGTSAGAITALLVSLNLYEDQQELMKYFTTDFTKYLDMENASLRSRITEFSQATAAGKGVALSSASSTFSSLGANKLGFASGNVFRAWIEGIIAEKTGIEHCTFKELNELETNDGRKKFKSFYVVAFDLEKQEEFIFSNDNTPDAIISDAIRSSISIPFIFEPHAYYCKNANEQRLVPDDMTDHNLIDGGIALNYAIRILDEITNPNEILGFYLTSKKVMEKHLANKKSKSDDPELEETNDIYRPPTSCSPLQCTYISKVFAIHKKFGGQGGRHKKYESRYDRTIYINHLNISSIEFNIDDITKTRLMDEGKKAVDDYFSGKTVIAAAKESHNGVNTRSWKCWKC